jgi:glycosyltransferase involved in cell wall biosynthesis
VGAPDLSVVVVAHNVAPYLQACLDSLAGQSVAADVEVVVVVGDPDDATGRIAPRRGAGGGPPPGAPPGPPAAG